MMLNFHAHTNDEGEVLILKRLPQSRETHGGFKWPSGVGSVVECPDWNAEPICGGGLHGWPWGWGLGEGSDYDIIGDVWLVLGAKPDDVVGELEGGAKCKARRVTIRQEGSFAVAMEAVKRGFRDAIDASVATAVGNAPDDSTAASAGDGSAAASAGYGSKSASAGERSTAASAGDGSKSASAGERSTAASAGDGSTAASAGDRSRAKVAGKDTAAAVVGHEGRVRVGERGAFAIAYWSNEDGWRFVIAKAGEDGIKSDTWYRVEHGVLKEVN